ncbi:hypothetical protein JW906_07400, partial [bacterium]|nr:hypothetical protein [bacterium]
SLEDIRKGLSRDTPLFFSTTRVNIRWVGGNFKHDFIVLPETCEAGSGADRFYDTLFGCVFGDMVNLDTINRDSARLKNLVERGIVGKEALCPECRVVGEKSLTPPQASLLEEIGGILDDPKVREAIETHLHIPVRAIRPVWITIENGNAYISTGILNEGGAPIDEAYVSNLLKEEGGRINRPVDILLGLSLDHPFVKRLIASKNPHRAYYSLTFIAHQLALSQRLLVPYSPFFHLVKEKLAAGMRSALIEQISGKEAAA